VAVDCYKSYTCLTFKTYVYYRYISFKCFKSCDATGVSESHWSSCKQANMAKKVLVQRYCANFMFSALDEQKTYEKMKAQAPGKQYTNVFNQLCKTVIQ
jgi:hypothetical protein